MAPQWWQTIKQRVAVRRAYFRAMHAMRRVGIRWMVHAWASVVARQLLGHILSGSNWDLHSQLRVKFMWAHFNNARSQLPRTRR